MKNYTPSSATYSNTIKIVESENALNPNNTNAAAKQLIENDIALISRINNLKKVPVPTAYGSLTYDGTIQSQHFNNYIPSKMTISGDSAKNAGNYTAIFSLKSGYTWTDNTTTPKEVTWSISKGAGICTLSTNNITISNHEPTETVTVKSEGAILSAVSSNSSVCTASVNNSTITISYVSAGTATITVNIDETTNYNATTATISVVCDEVASGIWGVEWDGTSPTTWTRTDDAESFVDPVPAVNNGDGSSPFDECGPWAGMKRVEDSEAGTLVEIPKYWYKWTRNGISMKLQISDGEQEGFFVSPAHADRGDGKGERDKVYVGAYHSANLNYYQSTAGLNYQSITGVKPITGMTRDTARTNIHNLGSTIWQYDFAMYWTIMMLYLVEFADWNSQKTIGYGCGNNSGTENNGLTDSMTYHTGTNASKRTTYGHIRYRYIEGLWDNVYDWCDGIYFSGSDVSDIYCIKNPANFSDTSNGTFVGTRATSIGYIKTWTNPTASGFEYALYPNSVGGSNSTYTPDRCYYSSSGVVLDVGGYHVQSQDLGAFNLNGNNGAAYAGAYVGTRLQKLP